MYHDVEALHEKWLGRCGAATLIFMSQLFFNFARKRMALTVRTKQRDNIKEV